MNKIKLRMRKMSMLLTLTLIFSMFFVFKLPGTVKGDSTITVVSLNKSYTTTPVPIGYLDTGNAELTNGITGINPTLWNGNVTGFNADATIVIDLEAVTSGLFKFEARYMIFSNSDRPNHMGPIGSGTISVSNDNVNWTPVGSLTIPNVTENSFQVAVLELQDGVAGRYVKYSVTKADTNDTYIGFDELTVSAKTSTAANYNIALEPQGATTNDVVLTGGGSAENGTTKTITAAVKPNKNYVFDKWVDGSGNTVSTNPVYSFTVSGNATYKAVFKPFPQYTVTASSNNTTLGTVSSAGGTYNYGASVSLTAVPSGSNTFVCWQENGKQVSTNSTYSFTVKGTHNICAYFAEAGKHKVIFKDEGGQIFKVESVANGQAATAPEDTSKAGYEFIGWDKTFNNITADTVVTASYKQPNTMYSINVTNGTIAGGSTSGSYRFDTFVTVQSSNPSTFSYWKDGSNKIVSYDASYSFYVSDNIALTAVNNDSKPKVPIATVSRTITGNGTVSFVAQCTIPAGTAYTIEECGVLLSQSNNPDLGTVGVIRGKAGSRTAQTGQFMITKVNAKGQTWYGRAYIIYKDGSGNLFTVYSDAASGTGL